MTQNTFDRLSLQFYNSFCGHCRRFAPIYDELAANLSLWYPDILHITALDCSVEENSDICRDFEVMAYPTCRYMPPHYEEGDKKLGLAIDRPFIDDIMQTVVGNITTEKHPPASWPSFTWLTNANKQQLFNGLNNTVEYIFIYYESPNSTIGAQLILDLHKVSEVRVRRVSNESVLVSSDLGVNSITRCIAVDRTFNVYNLNVMHGLSKDTILNKIVGFLKDRSVELPKEVTQKHEATTASSVSEISDVLRMQQEEAIRTKVKSQLGTVYLADLEMAVRHLLFVEAPMKAVIEGESLSALQRLVSVLIRYFPFNENGRRYVKDVQEYIMNTDRILGGDLDDKMGELEKKHRPLFSSNRWVGCLGSKDNFRRYPCGLWTMFHFLTVQAAETELSNDPLEVLQGMHGYIKNFFGCTDCSQHFQQMAARNRVWNTVSKDEAVLWLWSGHNEVNKRLSGDLTEDPDFPKQQFPTEAMCPSCRRPPSSNVKGHQIIGEIEWDKYEVLNYLKRINLPANLNLLGIQNETTVPKMMALVGANRSYSSLTEMDIRAGMLLYLFCVVMMVVAVKLFLRRGYRKKLYVHDLLGKV